MRNAARVGGLHREGSSRRKGPAAEAAAAATTTTPRARFPPRSPGLPGGAALGLLVVLILPVPGAAQWQVGLQGGGTLATLGGSLAEGVEPTFGGALGGDLELWLGPDWVVDLDVAVVQKGAGDLPADGERPDLVLTYLEVPVTVGRAFPVLGEGWRIAPYAGAALAWMSGCGLRRPGDRQDVDCTETTPGGAPARLDPSVPVGVALRHRYPGGSRLSVELRYSPSLIPVLSPGNLSARSHVLQALFAFTLPLSEPVP